jgi:hypothetical protein
MVGLHHRGSAREDVHHHQPFSLSGRFQSTEMGRGPEADSVSHYSDDDRSVAADSWSVKSEYGSVLDLEDQRQGEGECLGTSSFRTVDYRLADSIRSLLWEFQIHGFELIKSHIAWKSMCLYISHVCGIGMIVHAYVLACICVSVYVAL